MRKLIRQTESEFLSLCWLAGFLAVFLASSTAEAYEYTIHPSDDTFVSTITGDAKNYGVNYLYLSDSSGRLSYAYLRFPLDQIAENEENDTATLKMYALYGFRSDISVHYVAFDDWTEKTITWNDQPSDYATPVLLDSTFLDYAYSNIEFDLLKNSQWPISSDIEDGYLTIMLSVDSQGEVFLASKEIFYDDWLPTLNITTHQSIFINNITPTPIPSSLTLILSGLLALRGSTCLLARKRRLIAKVSRQLIHL
jgi:hypothetical protein